MQPTEEQEKWFWEQCGLTWQYYSFSVKTNEKITDAGWVFPDGEFHFNLPPIDLNNLFKYAVPKLEPLGYDLDISNDLELLGWSVCCHNTKSECSIASPMVSCKLEDIALALFWTIYKAFGGKNADNDS